MEETIEPYLLKLKFIEKGKSGRILTTLGINYIKKKVNLFLD
ncbi:MAG: Holliday junction DNA helicase RuvB C-terminal domain-containing protein [Bacilli bacterium]